MLTPIECTLKADNYAAAARLDVTGRRVRLSHIAAAWRGRALRASARQAGIFIPANSRWPLG